MNEEKSEYNRRDIEEMKEILRHYPDELEDNARQIISLKKELESQNGLIREVSLPAMGYHDPDGKHGKLIHDLSEVMEKHQKLGSKRNREIILEIDRLLYRRMHLLKIYQSYQALPKKDHELLCFLYVKNGTYKEICINLRISQSTLKRRIRRAFARMQKLMEKK